MFSDSNDLHTLVVSQGIQPPEWLLRMADDYYRTGCVRTEDLYRLLGDPSKGVVMKPRGEYTLADLAPEWKERIRP